MDQEVRFGPRQTLPDEHTMKIGIVGAGILGLALAYYLQTKGHRVDIYERNHFLGGLACSFNYGSFVWDKFYHVILSKDTHLLALLKEIGLEKDLRWRNTGTGHYTGGAFYSLSNTREMLKFPLLSWSDKIRMGLAAVYAVRFANPGSLHRVTAKEWVIRTFGESNYTQFWKPLLRAKFGDYADKVAAVFIWASLKRLLGRAAVRAEKESTGYVHGGYHHILRTLRAKLESGATRIFLGAKIHSISLESEVAQNAGPHAALSGSPCNDPPSPEGDYTPCGRHQCGINVSITADTCETHWFDKVIFTGPKQFAVPILSHRLRDIIDLANDTDNKATQYLGVVCLSVVLRRPLTPYYLLSIADESIPLTGMIEMTNLISMAEETAGLSLVYLPRYVDSSDPFLRAEDGVVYDQLFERGLRRLFPDLRSNEVVSWHVQRATHVQPIPLVCESVPALGNRLPNTDCEFVLANSSLLGCATLNNNEIVGLAKEIALRI